MTAVQRGGTGRKAARLDNQKRRIIMKKVLAILLAVLMTALCSPAAPAARPPRPAIPPAKAQAPARRPAFSQPQRRRGCPRFRRQNLNSAREMGAGFFQPRHGLLQEREIQGRLYDLQQQRPVRYLQMGVRRVGKADKLRFPGYSFQQRQRPVRQHHRDAFRPGRPGLHFRPDTTIYPRLWSDEELNSPS
jgi:hypothetical protein